MKTLALFIFTLFFTTLCLQLLSLLYYYFDYYFDYVLHNYFASAICHYFD